MGLARLLLFLNFKFLSNRVDEYKIGLFEFPIFCPLNVKAQ